MRGMKAIRSSIKAGAAAAGAADGDGSVLPPGTTVSGCCAACWPCGFMRLLMAPNATHDMPATTSRASTMTASIQGTERMGLTWIEALLYCPKMRFGNR
ncbi:hypothetical protein D3C71_1635500 [compost metagenome]